MSEGRRNVFLAFICIAFGGLLFGYIIGITSNVVTSGQMICPDQWTGYVGTWTSFGYNQCYQLSSLEKGALTSMNLIGAVVASMFCFRFADIMGRRLEVIVGAGLYVIGALTASLFPTLWAIYVGFFIYGLGIGFAMHAAPIYIAEISPSDIRGTLVSAKEMVIVFGMFLGFFVGWVFSGHRFGCDGWRFMVGLGAVFGVLMGVGIQFIPQSPRWLALRAAQTGALLGYDSVRIEQARTALQFFRRAELPEQIDQELMAINDDAAEAVRGGTKSAFAAFQYPWPLFIGCGLVFLQQVTGQPSVLYFATNIFKFAGFGDSAALQSVLIGAVKLLATGFTVFRVDKYGRRPLLLVGIVMMVAALAILGVAFLHRTCSAEGVTISDCSTDDISLPRGWAIATVAGLMFYVSGYQVGFGPVSWLMISEVFPLSVRGSAMSTAAIVNFGANILVTLTQDALLTALTPSGVFFGYMVLAILSIFFVYTIVPETKGKTLEQIESMLAPRKARNGPLVGGAMPAP